jgi:hypothetical protein
MAKSNIIYEEETELTVRLDNQRGKEFLNFGSQIRIKGSGKTPVEMCLTFDGPPPFAAPMPPGKYTIKAESVVDLYQKTLRWLRRNGYKLV